MWVFIWYYLLKDKQILKGFIPDGGLGMISYEPLAATLKARGMTVIDLEDELGYYSLKDKLNMSAYLSLETVDKIGRILGVESIDELVKFSNREHVFRDKVRPVFVKPDWARIRKLNGIRGWRIMSVEMGHRGSYMSALSKKEWISIDVIRKVKEYLDTCHHCSYDLSSLYTEVRYGRAERSDKKTEIENESVL